MCISVKIINRGYQFVSREDGRSLREGNWEKLEEGKNGGVSNSISIQVY